MQHRQPQRPMGVGPGGIPLGMTPEAAAIAAIQSVAPPPVEPKPQYRFFATKSGLQLFTGGGIAGEIDFEGSVENRTQVRDELTARRSAQEFTAYLNRVRAQRSATWDGYWARKLVLNEDILNLEREAFTDSQLMAAEEEFSDDEDTPRRVRTAASVPVITPNTGAFDTPRPRPVLIPDPRDVLAMDAIQRQQMQRRMAAQSRMVGRGM